MLVVKIGGPAYRIGMGGGAASSMVQGENTAELDFDAVQRGDAEMEQKLNRVIRACSELGDANPIVSIHDQGAGGNCNVLKETRRAAGRGDRHPLGARGRRERCRCSRSGEPSTRRTTPCCSDPSIATLFGELCAREKVPCCLRRSRSPATAGSWSATPADGSRRRWTSMLDHVLGDMPQKSLRRLDRRPTPLRGRSSCPTISTASAALDRVLRLLSGGLQALPHDQGRPRRHAGSSPASRAPARSSSRWPTVAVIAQSATLATEPAPPRPSVNSPLKGLGGPRRHGARMAVGGGPHQPRVGSAPRPSGDVRCSANWMWAAKLPGERARPSTKRPWSP
jgi:phosphoribosylformylglycinamidine synthase